MRTTNGARTVSAAAILAMAIAVWLGGAGRAAAQPPTAAGLAPCVYSLGEVAQALGVTLARAEAADMTIPVGRDVGCVYSLKGSDFVFGVRQTWDSTRAAAGAAKVLPGFSRIPHDPDGAIYVSDSERGSSGQLVYVRGKVQTTIFWHGGNLTAADGLRRLLLLRRVP